LTDSVCQQGTEGYWDKDEDGDDEEEDYDFLIEMGKKGKTIDSGRPCQITAPATGFKVFACLGVWLLVVSIIRMLQHEPVVPRALKGEWRPRDHVSDDEMYGPSASPLANEVLYQGLKIDILYYPKETFDQRHHIEYYGYFPFLLKNFSPEGVEWSITPYSIADTREFILAARAAPPGSVVVGREVM